jgi:aerobic-type carbon monoxide dehydrogenase small subunit (CoxS/CutS family)
MTQLAKTPISFELNGWPVSAEVRGAEPLLHLLRNTLGFRGTKEGCGQGECGACTVLVDGDPVNACLFPAAEIAGRQVTTIEGLAGPHGELSPVQQAFVEQGGIQCGFCSPGMILSAHALLSHHPDPTDEQIREALLGNLCRCTGYVQIIQAVRHAAAQLRAGRGPTEAGGAA